MEPPRKRTRRASRAAPFVSDSLDKCTQRDASPVTASPIPQPTRKRRARSRQILVPTTAPMATPPATAAALSPCEVLVGDCRTILSGRADGSFACCVTSPPYWGMRDYGVDGQIGAVASLDAYISSLVVFREVKRLLSPRGTLWLNLGDSQRRPRDSRARQEKRRARDGLPASNTRGS